MARYYQPPEAGDNDAMVMVRAGLRGGKAGWLRESVGGCLGVWVCIVCVHFCAITHHSLIHPTNQPINPPLSPPQTPNPPPP